MQKLRLKMSQETKDAQRGKERLSKNAKRCTKTWEECAKCRKTMHECVKRQQQTETYEQDWAHIYNKPWRLLPPQMPMIL